MVATSDERKVVVTAAADGRKLQGMTTKRGFFNLQEPTQEYTSLLIAPDNRVTFYCSTTSPWFDCKWKHPSHKDPCGIFHTDPNKICHFTSPNGGNGLLQRKVPNAAQSQGIELMLLKQENGIAPWIHFQLMEQLVIANMIKYRPIFKSKACLKLW